MSGWIEEQIEDERYLSMEACSCRFEEDEETSIPTWYSLEMGEGSFGAVLSVEDTSAIVHSRDSLLCRAALELQSLIS